VAAACAIGSALVAKKGYTEEKGTGRKRNGKKKEREEKGDAAHGFGLHVDSALSRWGDGPTSSKMPGWNVLPSAQPGCGAIDTV
jgi:hypothetical protein